MTSSFCARSYTWDLKSQQERNLILIKEVDTTNEQMGSCISGGTQCHTRLLVLGEGGEGDTNICVLLLIYLRTVLIFIKQYSGSMCFSSILAESYESYRIYVK